MKEAEESKESEESDDDYSSDSSESSVSSDSFVLPFIPASCYALSMTFVVLCSSRGTVLRAVLERMKDGSLTARCAGVIADSEDRGCVQLAKDFGVPVTIVTKKKDELREHYDKRLDAAIHDLMKSIDSQNSKLIAQDSLVACMGWMWMLSPWFVKKWKSRILNIHPALLPKHAGAHAHDLVLAAKEKESGMTIHLIDEGMDTGKILLQKTCPVLPDDTAATLKKRVQALECEWFPKVLQMIENGDLKL